MRKVPPELMNITETAAFLGLGSAATKEAMEAGQLPVVQIGKRTLVPRRALEQFLSTAGLRVEVTEPPPTLSVEEAATRLGVHPLTLRRAIKRGEVRAVHVGRRIVVPQASIEHLTGEAPASAS